MERTKEAPWIEDQSASLTVGLESALVGRNECPVAVAAAPAAWLLVPCGYSGDAPTDATVIRVPSNAAVIVGRVQVDAEADLAAVHAIQDQFSLTAAATNGPLAAFPTGDARMSTELRSGDR